MNEALGIPGVVLTPMDVHTDDRGFFSEIARDAAYPTTFVQANHSRSKSGVLRGLHYHRHQSDLWYVIEGSARVGLVELRTRRDPPVAAIVELDASTPATLFIPPGVAHGFFAKTDVDLVYLVDREYDAADEFGIAWNDPQLRLDWGTESPVLSNRDAENEALDWDLLQPFS